MKPIYEIIGPNNKVHYRRPEGHPDIAEAAATEGYSVRLEPKWILAPELTSEQYMKRFDPTPEPTAHPPKPLPEPTQPQEYPYWAVRDRGGELLTWTIADNPNLPTWALVDKGGDDRAEVASVRSKHIWQLIWSDYEAAGYSLVRVAIVEEPKP